MAIVASQVDYLASTSNVASYATTGGTTLHANRPFIIAVQNSMATDPPTAPNTPTTTHTNCTIKPAALQTLVYGATTLQKRITFFCGMATADSTGAFTVTFGASQSGCIIEIYEFDGGNRSAVDGSAAFTNFTTNTGTTGTSLTVAAGAFGNANGVSGTLAFIGHAANEATNPEDATHPAGGIAPDVLNGRAYGTPGTSGLIEYWGANHTNAYAYWTTSGYSGGVVCEVRGHRTVLLGSVPIAREFTHTPSDWQMLLENTAVMQMEDGRAITLERSGQALIGAPIQHGVLAHEVDHAISGSLKIVLPGVLVHEVDHAHAGTQKISASGVVVHESDHTLSDWQMLAESSDVMVLEDGREMRMERSGQALLRPAYAGGAAHEVDHAFAGTPKIKRVGVLAHEIDHAVGGSKRLALVGIPVVEVDHALSGVARALLISTGALVHEIDHVFGGIAQTFLTATGSIAHEIDHPNAGLAQGFRTIIGGLAHEIDHVYGTHRAAFVIKGGVTGDLLLEDGSALLWEDGSNALLENTATPEIDHAAQGSSRAGAGVTHEVDHAYVGRAIGIDIYSGNVAREIDGAYGGSLRITRVGAAAHEVDRGSVGVARTLLRAIGTLAHEVDAAASGSPRLVRFGSSTHEVDHAAHGAIFTGGLVVGHVVEEIDHVNGGAVRLWRIGATVHEINRAFIGRFRIARLGVLAHEVDHPRAGGRRFPGKTFHEYDHAHSGVPLGALVVRFGDVEAVVLSIDSDTQLTVESPAHAIGTVDVTVTTVVGTSLTTPDDLYTFTVGQLEMAHSGSSVASDEVAALKALLRRRRASLARR